MYCKKCGAELAEETEYCSKCGTKTSQEPLVIKTASKVILDPAEQNVHHNVKDSSKTFSGFGRTFGLILFILGLLADLVATILFASVSILAGGIAMIIGTVMFIVGILIRLFVP